MQQYTKIGDNMLFKDQEKSMVLQSYAIYEQSSNLSVYCDKTNYLKDIRKLIQSISIDNTNNYFSFTLLSDSDTLTTLPPLNELDLTKVA